MQPMLALAIRHRRRGGARRSCWPAAACGRAGCTIGRSRRPAAQDGHPRPPAPARSRRHVGSPSTVPRIFSPCCRLLGCGRPGARSPPAATRSGRAAWRAPSLPPRSPRTSRVASDTPRPSSRSRIILQQVRVFDHLRNRNPEAVITRPSAPTSSSGHQASMLRRASSRAASASLRCRRTAPQQPAPSASTISMPAGAERAASRR